MERERPHEPAPETTAPETEAAEAPALRIAVRGPDDGARSWGRVALLAALALTALAVHAWIGPASPVASGIALCGGVALLADLLLIGPALGLARRLRAESARLRAALACPYCKDALPEDAAVACDRKGCGAFYHAECWAECRASYGGCAIYGCGCTTGHQVGRLVLRGHVARLLLAALFFPPKLVKRLRESERQRLRDVWRQAQNVQHGVTRDEASTCLSAVANSVVSVGLTVVAVLARDADLISQRTLAILMVPLLALPIVLIRLPLLGAFAWGASRLVARAFRDELAALRRADEGTFLGRLAGGLGKKDSA